MADLHRGEEVYLVPTLPTAPSIAYKQPLVTIKTAGVNRCEIVLPDGDEMWTDSRNLVRKLPDPEGKPKNIMIRPKMPDGYEETSLW